MRHCKMTLEQAFDAVKSKRPYVWPNNAFWHQLELEEHKIFHSASRHVISEQKRPGERKAAAFQRQDAQSTIARAQLLEGSLHHAERELLDELNRDLKRFSTIHNVAAEVEVCQDRVDVRGDSVLLSPRSDCLLELEQILSFYGFNQVQWSSQALAKALVTPNATRW